MGNALSTYHYSQIGRVWEAYEQTLINNIKGGVTDKLPDFLVVAPSKCATTWLAEKLELHPEIGMPKQKETRFFDTLWMFNSLDWYKGTVNRAEAKFRGEACPSYCMLPLKALSFLRKYCPKLKIIVTLRDPLARTWSHLKHDYRFSVGYFKGLPLTFEVSEVMDPLWLQAMGDGVSWWTSGYHNFLERWTHYFPKDQFKFVFVENFEQNIEEEFKSILEFIGVDSRLSLTPFSLTAKSFEGVSLDMPQRIAPKLRSLLYEPYLKAVQFLENSLDLNVPSKWHDSFEGEQFGEPFVVSILNGWPIIFDNGEFRVSFRKFETNKREEILKEYSSKSSDWYRTESALQAQGVVRALEFCRIKNSVSINEFCKKERIPSIEEEIERLKFYAKDLFGYENSPFLQPLMLDIKQ